MIRSIALLGWLVWPGCLLAADPSLRFSMPDMTGAMQTLERYRGQWVIVNYWSTTCPPCLQEIPELIDFHARHKDRDAVVLGANFENIATPTLQAFIAGIGMNYPVLRTGPSPHTPFGVIVVLPTTFLVSPDGELMGQQIGAVTAKTLESSIAGHSHRKTAAGQTEPDPQEEFGDGQPSSIEGRTVGTRSLSSESSAAVDSSVTRGYARSTSTNNASLKRLPLPAASTPALTIPVPPQSRKKSAWRQASHRGHTNASN